MPLEIVGTYWTRRVRLQNGELVTLELEEDDLSRVTVLDAHGEPIGRLEFREIEEDHRSYHKLTWAFLNFLGPQYTHHGLGRAALQFWTSVSGQVAAVERHTGIRNEQGSHLTGDAPGFVAQMVDEGLLYYEDGGS